MKVGGIFTALKTSLFGLSGQMKKLEVISENIAHAEELPDENGNVYNRKRVVSKNADTNRARLFGNQMNLELRRTHLSHIRAADMRPSKKGSEASLKIIEEKGEKLIYNPGHPRADENGYVKMPDVNMVEEMVDLIASSRTYEANVTVLNAAKQMAKRALEI
jgi:flagellar basal-body rod protein FlgC